VCVCLPRRFQRKIPTPFHNLFLRHVKRQKEQGSGSFRHKPSQMSVRFSFEAQPQCAPSAIVGAIHGPAIGLPVGGFWGPLAVSPPRSPPLLATDSILSVEHLDLNGDDACVPMRVDARGHSEDTDESPLLEQICPIWVHDLSTKPPVLILFDQPGHGETETATTLLLQSLPRRLRVRGAVTPRLVRAEALNWRPLVEAGESVGVVFLLGSGRGESDDDDDYGAKPATRPRSRIDAIARIEVRCSSTSDADDPLGSVAVVQSSYSPLAMASGMADPSSFLLFPDPEAHLHSMLEVRAQLQRGEDVGYVPARELCVTSTFDRLVLRSNPSETGEHNDGARRAWQKTKSFLKSLSTLTADSVTAYNAAEIDRVGAFELRNGHGLWRGSVV